MTAAVADELKTQSLSTLHELAREAGIQGFRKLRKDALIEALVEAGVSAPANNSSPAQTREQDDQRQPERRSRRTTRTRRSATVQTNSQSVTRKTVKGLVEILDNGSGLIQPEDGERAVYVSPAQVKRCSLVSGDCVSGPIRSPRRSERHPALVRIEAINDKPASERPARPRSRRNTPEYPSEMFESLQSDPHASRLLTAAPFGKGSRVSIVGPTHSGKSSALKLIAQRLAGDASIELYLVLAGARSEEVSEYDEIECKQKSIFDFNSSAQDCLKACERAVNSANRSAARGSDAVVLIDSLAAVDDADAQAARKLMRFAKNLSGAGSLTIIATNEVPLGGETTVIAFDPVLAGLRRFPPIDFDLTSTLKPELLLDQSGLKAMMRMRAEAILAA